MTDFIRYLEAKRSVDDRALNRRVWERLQRELRAMGRNSLAIADIGAGIGTGAERMSDWGLLDPGVAILYIVVEPQPELLDQARRRLSALPYESTFVPRDLASFAGSGENEGRFDLVVAHAVLDILELATSLALLVRLVRPGGLLYLPITFDGETSFEPGRAEDEAVLDAYHETMDEKGSSRTGRRLFHQLRRNETDVLELGSSDWIVHPVGRAYPDDEAFFLRFIVSTVGTALRGRIDSKTLDSWTELRLRQIEEGDLVYSAHQIDVLARRRA